MTRITLILVNHDVLNFTDDAVTWTLEFAGTILQIVEKVSGRLLYHIPLSSIVSAQYQIV